MTSQRPVVQNVVSYGKMTIDEEINLKYLAEKIENSRFNKKRFPALIVRKTKPKCTIMVFKSGKIIVIGSESEKDAELAAKKLSKDIQKALNLKCKLSEFRITNLVANADFGYKVDLNKLAD
jgi:transcription initiation factor TFIID TATA-box-binding protein